LGGVKWFEFPTLGRKELNIRTTQRKHKILREYIARYLEVRCQLPRRDFKLAIVDGFAGGGRYSCGSPGSSIIFIEELKIAAHKINIQRAIDGAPPLNIKCLIILNDADKDVLGFLKSQVLPLHLSVNEDVQNLKIDVEFHNKLFEDLYVEIKHKLLKLNYRNVLFCLDQCGHTHVQNSTLRDIISSFQSPEIFYTFMIKPLVSFLTKSNPQMLNTQLAHLGLSSDNLRPLEALMSKREWLGAAERIVYGAFSDCATFVSPFSIHNPDGWRYWLIHFAKKYRARQEYNIVLHNNSNMQAHYGRAGLMNMLAFNPKDANSLYLFDEMGRENAVNELSDDIPRLINQFHNILKVSEFYEQIYRMTPAHRDDIHTALINNSDLEIVTTGGGVRRTPNNIEPTDILRIRDQRSLFPISTKKKKNDLDR